MEIFHHEISTVVELSPLPSVAPVGSALFLPRARRVFWRTLGIENPWGFHGKSRRNPQEMEILYRGKSWKIMENHGKSMNGGDLKKFAVGNVAHLWMIYCS